MVNSDKLPEMKQERKEQRKRAPILSDRIVPKILLTYDEAAWSIGISKSKLYAMVSQGKIPVVIIGGNTLFRPQDLEELAKKNWTLKNQ